MKKRIDYAGYDAKLLRLIDNGCNTFDSLVRRLDAENRAIDPDSRDPWRVTDRRLQALRRKSLIVYHLQKWHLMPQ